MCFGIRSARASDMTQLSFTSRHSATCLAVSSRTSTFAGVETGCSGASSVASAAVRADCTTALRISRDAIADFDSPANTRGLDATSSSAGTAASGCLVGTDCNQSSITSKKAPGGRHDPRGEKPRESDRPEERPAGHRAGGNPIHPRVIEVVTHPCQAKSRASPSSVTMMVPSVGVYTLPDLA